MNTSIIFPKHTCDLQNYYFFNQGFSTEELDKIYKEVDIIPFQQAIIGNDEENLDIRSSSIKWIPPNEEWRWLYEKLMSMIMEANDAIWHFDFIARCNVNSICSTHINNLKTCFGILVK